MLAIMFSMSDIIVAKLHHSDPFYNRPRDRITAGMPVPAGNFAVNSSIPFNTMKTSQQMVNLIMQWEGFRAKAYRCPAGVLTVGYGHTGADVAADTHVNENEAAGMLLSDLAVVERSVESMALGAGLALAQNQFDALVSLAFNIGAARLRRSMLWRKISNHAQAEEIASEFRRWIYSNGKILPGLVKRREREASIYSGLGYA